MSHSARLRAKIELVAPGMHRAIEAFWAHPRMPEIFPEFLYTTYCVGRTTVPLLEAALATANARREADPVAACVADYCARHIPEERHHDEGVLEDLGVLGVSREVGDAADSLPYDGGAYWGAVLLGAECASGGAAGLFGGAGRRASAGREAGRGDSEDGASA